MKRYLLSVALSLFALSGAQATQLMDVPGQFKPLDLNGHTITGKVNFWGDRIVFEGGKWRSFTRLPEKMGEWGPRTTVAADILKLEGDDEPTPKGKHLCSEDRPATYLALYHRGDRMFMQSFTGSEEPTGYKSEGACEQFLYQFPEGFDPTQVVRQVGTSDGSTKTSEDERQAAVAQRQAGLRGDWRISREKDPITDRAKMYLTLRASEHDVRTVKTPQLVLRCVEGELSVHVNWHVFISAKDRVSDDIKLTFRLDSADPQTSNWGLSTDNTATFYGGNDTIFMRSLAETDTFVARVTPYRDPPATAIFHIEGLSAHIDELFETCGRRF
ncbi:hypothetical protein ACFOHK_15040 [Falsigemmobacter intermedius]|uniref:DUF3108 domain-containing protein n=1 Tax=Falsigemmobacter intermedius TaxID=1553448 RepID=A0A3S3U600_9RHOB|nr:hypothetical protein [Falsigemmobacter intermedius]RWY35041.1 hypothetical protein EP867_18955 [Falsigemmobacter intermedius]